MCKLIRLFFKFGHLLNRQTPLEIKSVYNEWSCHRRRKTFRSLKPCLQSLNSEFHITFETLTSDLHGKQKIKNHCIWQQIITSYQYKMCNWQVGLPHNYNFVYRLFINNGYVYKRHMVQLIDPVLWTLFLPTKTNYTMQCFGRRILHSPAANGWKEKGQGRVGF